MRKYLYILTLAVLACTGCDKKVEMDLDMYNSEQVSLMVKGKKVFTFDEGTGQLGYNRTLRQFRTGNDDMTSFFVLTCSELFRSKWRNTTTPALSGCGMPRTRPVRSCES